MLRRTCAIAAIGWNADRRRNPVPIYTSAVLW
jgi:hypothetical protein